MFQLLEWMGKQKELVQGLDLEPVSTPVNPSSRLLLTRMSTKETKRHHKIREWPENIFSLFVLSEGCFGGWKMYGNTKTSNMWGGGAGGVGQKRDMIEFVLCMQPLRQNRFKYQKVEHKIIIIMINYFVKIRHLKLNTSSC